MKHIVIALFIIIFSSLTFGQSANKTVGNGLKKRQIRIKNSSSANVTKKKWTLVEINGAAIEIPNPILRFYEKDRSFNIHLCNSTHGRYLFKGNKLQFSKMTSTLVACREPLASYERKLNEALIKKNRFTQTADSLIFLANNKPLLKFIFEKQSTIPNKNFGEADWILTDIGNKKIPSEKLSFLLRFGIEEKMVSGRFGCNHLSGGYKVFGDTFEFRNFLITRMPCQTRENDEIEREFAQALNKVERFELNNKTLSFFEGKTFLLKFSPIKDDSGQRF